MELPNKFKIARQALGKSQKEMADLVRCAYRSWQGYEQGTSVPGGNVLKALAELDFNVNWFFDDSDTPMFIEPRNKEGHIDMVKEIAYNDKEATARRMQKMASVTTCIKKARDEVQSYREEIKESPVDVQIEALSEKLKSETFNRLAAEERLDKEARMDTKQQQPALGSGFDDLGMAEGMGLLSRIYGSGDIVFIRAINANLMAFGAAIANKAQAVDTMRKMEEMETRVMAMEQKIAGMEIAPEKKLQSTG